MKKSPTNGQIYILRETHVCGTIKEWLINRTNFSCPSKRPAELHNSHVKVDGGKHHRSEVAHEKYIDRVYHGRQRGRERRRDVEKRWQARSLACQALRAGQ
jgi:hypothetical protein